MTSTPRVGDGKCPCAIPDSFNVRASDLINPDCPYHGQHAPKEKS